MDLREMQYILEIEKTGHLTQAANNLFISQPALSKTLRKLEAELGSPLFYKDSNVLRPTDTGEIVLEKAKAILKLVDEMNDDVAASKNLKQGKVRMGVPPVVMDMYFSELIIQFEHTYPGIDLQIEEAGGTALTNRVAAGSLDTAIIMRPVYCDLLSEIPVLKNQTVACVNKTHPWAARNYVTIRDFKNTPFITFDSTFNVHSQLIKRFNEEKITPVFLRTASSCHFLYQYAHQRGGILVLPKPMIEMYCCSDDVRMIPFSPSFPWELCLIFRKNIFMSMASKALINFIQEYFLQKSFEIRK